MGIISLSARLLPPAALPVPGPGWVRRLVHVGASVMRAALCLAGALLLFCLGPLVVGLNLAFLVVAFCTLADKNSELELQDEDSSLLGTLAAYLGGGWALVRGCLGWLAQGLRPQAPG
mgnify:CR=1 FL=1